jgi:predicted MPP superfamily phosphohydrolase
VKDHRYVAGLNRWRDRFIHTSTGVATTSHLRVNCRPEVTILDLIAT